MRLRLERGREGGSVDGKRGRGSDQARDRLRLRFLLTRCYMTSRHGSETNSHCFSVSLSYCFAAIGRSDLSCFVLFCFTMSYTAMFQF